MSHKTFAHASSSPAAFMKRWHTTRAFFGGPSHLLAWIALLASTHAECVC